MAKICWGGWGNCPSFFWLRPWYIRYCSVIVIEGTCPMYSYISRSSYLRSSLKPHLNFRELVFGSHTAHAAQSRLLVAAIGTLLDRPIAISDTAVRFHHHNRTQVRAKNCIISRATKSKSLFRIRSSSGPREFIPMAILLHLKG